MTRLAFLFAGILLSTTVFAQYSGPAVQACLDYAKREMARDGNKAKDVVIERDEHLAIERYTRKLGSQFVSSILTGNGAVVLDNAPAAELGFICLLADEKRAVFFEWLPRANASALTQCTRDSALRAQPRSCLEVLLRIAENDLIHVYGLRFQEARERDHKANNEAAITAYRRANDEWRQYRDAECERRRDHAPEGVAAGDYQLACIVDLTRRRALDLR